MKKFNHIRVPILNDEYWVDVVWGGKPEDWWKFSRKKFKDVTIPLSWFDDKRGQVLRRKDFNPLIVMQISQDDKHFWATLAHEAVHAIDEIWEMISENAKRHEVFAHSVGAVVAAVEKKIKG